VERPRRPLPQSGLVHRAGGGRAWPAVEVAIFPPGGRLRVLQFLPDSQNTARHACDGNRDHKSGVDACGFSGRIVLSPLIRVTESRRLVGFPPIGPVPHAVYRESVDLIWAIQKRSL